MRVYVAIHHAYTMYTLAGVFMSIDQMIRALRDKYEPDDLDVYAVDAPTTESCDETVERDEYATYNDSGYVAWQWRAVP